MLQVTKSFERRKTKRDFQQLFESHATHSPALEEDYMTCERVNLQPTRVEKPYNLGMRKWT